MNYEHEALKRKIMDMHGGKKDGKVMPDAHGDMAEHEEGEDKIADEIAGAAPSLKAHEEGDKLAEKPALVAGPIESSPHAAGEEHGMDEEEEKPDEISPEDHEEILKHLKSRGSSPLMSKAHEMMSKKMKMHKRA